MTLIGAVAAELRKIVTLPASLVGIGVAVLGSLGLVLLNAQQATRSDQPAAAVYGSPAEAMFSAMPIGVIGAVVLGVVAISSEYSASSPDAGGGRQITATLAAMPGRFVLIVAKALAVGLLIAATAAVTILAGLGLAGLILGDHAAGDPLGGTVARACGAMLYWALMGLIAFGITVLTRSGIVPLIVLIANSSLVSLSFLLSRLTPLARFLPDLAGVRLFAKEDFVHIGVPPLDPLTGGLVMAAWAIGLLAVSAVVFARRDA